MTTEDRRRKYATACMWIGWSGALLFASLRVAHVIPMDYEVMVVPIVGAAISATLARSRYRLEDSIIATMRTGMDIARQQRNREDDWSK